MNAHLSRHVPWLLPLIVAVWIIAPLLRSQPDELTRIGGIPVVEQGRTKPLDTVARNTLLAVSKRQTFIDQDGKRQPAIVWLLDHMSGADRSSKHRIVRIENQEVLDLLELPARAGSFRYSLEEISKHYKDVVPAMRAASRKEQPQRDLFDRKLLDLSRRLQVLDALGSGMTPMIIAPEKPAGAWQSLSAAASAAKGGAAPSPELQLWINVVRAWIKTDTAAFRQATIDLENRRLSVDPDALSHAKWEQIFHKSDIFYQAMLAYLLAFLLVAAGWLGWSGPLTKAATRVVFITFVIHTIALISRMVLQGRPPVTNLYSSAIFVGWAGVVAALIMERIFKNGIGAAVGAAVGAASLLVAHHLAGDGDTMEMMRAVLDTNFWLATHVTVVTIGYSANFLAGSLAIIFVIRGVLTPSLTPDMMRNMTRMIYGTFAFATLFSFVGTVLGGIWADQSWGRFWGWDPKENGALLIVMFDAMALHARWGGMVRQRGLAIIALFGNIVTAWSWFGVNMLGVGLHSYGFTEGASRALILFALANLVLIGVASVPLRSWRSVAAAAATKAAAKAAKQGVIA